MADLTPSGYLGIDDAIAAFGERIHRGVPECDHVRELQESGLSIGSPDRWLRRKRGGCIRLFFGSPQIQYFEFVFRIIPQCLWRKEVRRRLS